MTIMPQRLLAVAITPLSYMWKTAPSAIEVVHNLRFTRAGGGFLPGEARLRLSPAKSTLALSMRDSGVSRRAVEIWRLTDRLSADRSGDPRQPSGDGFVVVILQRLQDAGESGTLDLVFDLSQSATMGGCIDLADLRRLGFAAPGARATGLEGLSLAPAAPLKPVQGAAGPSPEFKEYRAGRGRGRPPANEGAARRRSQAAARECTLQTGAFATRRELTAQIWALRRQQVFPNLAAIARACETSPDVVRVVIREQEGLDGYLKTGCLMG